MVETTFVCSKIKRHTYRSSEGSSCWCEQHKEEDNQEEDDKKVSTCSKADVCVLGFQKRYLKTYQ